MNGTGVDDYMDAQHKRIAELEAELQKQDDIAEDAWSENAKLEAEIERLTPFQDSYLAQKLVIDLCAADLKQAQAKNERLGKAVNRYRDALSDIQEHSAGEGGDSYLMQEIADAAMEGE